MNSPCKRKIAYLRPERQIRSISNRYRIIKCVGENYQIGDTGPGDIIMMIVPEDDPLLVSDQIMKALASSVG